MDVIYTNTVGNRRSITYKGKQKISLYRMHPWGFLHIYKHTHKKTLIY